MTEGPSLDDLATTKWAEIIPLVDQLVERAETQGEWRVVPHTALAADDAKSRPHQMSHAARMLLNAGIDNLNGVRHLVFGRPDAATPSIVLHQAAHAVLARGAIENFAAGIWMLGPQRRDVRLERLLRWHVKNVKDQHAAVDRFGAEASGSRTRDEKLNELIGKMIGIGGDSRGIRTGYTTTQTLVFADEFTGRDTQGLPSHFIWQLCSGFAHARPWASLSTLEREEHDTNDPNVVHLRLTSDISRALLAPLRAIELCEAMLARWHMLNTPAHT
ncbi:hypothetical protein [Pimelobacter simplex]|uniref:hypothetical protein n=1 Tax=Nocardioides simplex TaxID=2045 RepID=UPI003AB06354